MSFYCSLGLLCLLCNFCFVFGTPLRDVPNFDDAFEATSDSEDQPLNLDLSNYFSDDETSLVDSSTPEFPTTLNSRDFEEVSSDAAETDDISLDDVISKQDLFEGDIQGLTEDTVESFVHQSNAVFDSQKDSEFVQNSAVRGAHNLWPKSTIPYVISSRYSRAARRKLAAAIADYHQYTCLRFVPRQNSHKDYIYIKPAGGCWSNVGRSGGVQTVSLDANCVYHGTILHEFMHAAGFFHEQSRNDRDSYVTVLWDNIIPGFKTNFKKYSLNVIKHLGTEYDYKSVMHYGPKYFGINDQTTIVPRGGKTIGQRKGFSPTDIKDLNLLYQCDNPNPGSTAAPSTPAPQPRTTTTPRPRPKPRTTPAPRPTSPKPAPLCRYSYGTLKPGYYKLQFASGNNRIFYCEKNNKHGRISVFWAYTMPVFHRREIELRKKGYKRQW